MRQHKLDEQRRDGLDEDDDPAGIRNDEIVRREDDEGQNGVCKTYMSQSRISITILNKFSFKLILEHQRTENGETSIRQQPVSATETLQVSCGRHGDSSIVQRLESDFQRHCISINVVQPTQLTCLNPTGKSFTFTSHPLVPLLPQSEIRHL